MQKKCPKACKLQAPRDIRNNHDQKTRIFEGSFTGINKLCIPSTSKRTQDAEMFIDFCARPDNQARFAREMRLAPVISQKRAGLNDIEFSEVSTSIEPIPPAAQTMVKDADYLQRLWQRMITS